MFELDLWPFSFSYPMYFYKGSTWEKVEGKYVTELSASGIKEEDIKVTVEKSRGYYVIRVEGETKGKKYKYATYQSYALTERPELVEWGLKDGIITLWVTFKEPEVKEPPIEVKHLT